MIFPENILSDWCVPGVLIKREYSKYPPDKNIDV